MGLQPAGGRLVAFLVNARSISVLVLTLGLGGCSDGKGVESSSADGTTEAGGATTPAGASTTPSSGDTTTAVSAEGSSGGSSSSGVDPDTSTGETGGDSSDGDSGGSSTGGEDVVLPNWGELQLEQTVCVGEHWSPTVAGLDGTFAVGCVPDGSQQLFPTVHFLDGVEGELAQDTLLNSDGNYYLDISLTSHNDRLQATYQYNCDDNGSWLEGWGWGCVDYREYDDLGGRLNDPTVFGNTGHNGHPVIDWSGTSYGVAWISYDEVYFRRLDSDGLFAGDPLDNVHVGPDPAQPDQRDGARTKIVWNAERQEYAIYSISGYNLYRGRVSEAGDVLEMPTLIAETAYSQTFGGQFVALAWGEDDYLLYHDESDLVLARVFAGAGGMTEVVVQEGEYRFPSMVLRGEALLVFRQQPKTGFGEVIAYDANLQQLPESGGLLGDGVPMVHPQGAVDPATGAFAVAYNDESGSVLFRTIGD